MLVLVLAAATFVGGLYLGLRIGRYGQIEESIVRNATAPQTSTAARSDSRSIPAARVGDARIPDASNQTDVGSGPATTRSEPRTEPTSNPDTGNRSGDTQTEVLTNRSGAGEKRGRYVILLGSYSPDGAAKLTTKLKGIAALRRVPYSACRAMSEARPGESVFRLTHPRNRTLERVYVGCYDSLRAADAALRLLKQEGLLSSTSAQLIDIE